MILSENQRKFLVGQHELCEPVDSVRVMDVDPDTGEPYKDINGGITSRSLNNSERKTFLTKKRVMRVRIRKKLDSVEEKIQEFLSDLNLLEGFMLKENLESTFQDAIDKSKEIKEKEKQIIALKKFIGHRPKTSLRNKKKGLRFNARFKCQNCGVEQRQTFVDFKNNELNFVTFGGRGQ